MTCYGAAGGSACGVCVCGGGGEGGSQVYVAAWRGAERWVRNAAGVQLCRRCGSMTQARAFLSDRPSRCVRAAMRDRTPTHPFVIWSLVASGTRSTA